MIPLLMVATCTVSLLLSSVGIVLFIVVEPYYASSCLLAFLIFQSVLVIIREIFHQRRISSVYDSSISIRSSTISKEPDHDELKLSISSQPPQVGAQPRTSVNPLFPTPPGTPAVARKDEGMYPLFMPVNESSNSSNTQQPLENPVAANMLSDGALRETHFAQDATVLECSDRSEEPPSLMHLCQLTHEDMNDSVRVGVSIHNERTRGKVLSILDSLQNIIHYNVLCAEDCVDLQCDILLFDEGRRSVSRKLRERAPIGEDPLPLVMLNDDADDALPSLLRPGATAGYSSGASAFMTKPVSKMSIVEILEHYTRFSNANFAPSL
eukprot:PhF_6_TR27851/c1_g1_i1/m.40682